MKKYIVRLIDEERQQLENLINKGQAQAYKIKHANILLKADAEGSCWTDVAISKAFGCHRVTVENVRKRFVEQGLQAALERKKQEKPPREKILDGDGEARLIALSCSQPPEGRSRWSLALLADKLIELDVVESISYRTVGRTLKKTN